MDNIEIEEYAVKGANGNTVRVVLMDNDYWFLTKDLGDIAWINLQWLLHRRVRESDKRKVRIQSNGRYYDVNVVNANGVRDILDWGVHSPRSRRFQMLCKWFDGFLRYENLCSASKDSSVDTAEESKAPTEEHTEEPTTSESKGLMVFENNEFGKVRTILKDGEPWFVGKDVAEILGYSNPRKAMIDHIDAEDKQDGVTIRDSIGREQNPTVINESGLYSLILSSKLPKAKKFKRWVTSEVLPAIRKNGYYATARDDFEERASLLAEERKIYNNILEAQRGFIEEIRGIFQTLPIYSNYEDGYAGSFVPATNNAKRGELCSKVSKYARKTGQHITSAWSAWVRKFNRTYNTKIHCLRGSLTNPVYLEHVGMLDEGIDVIDNMLTHITTA